MRMRVFLMRVQSAPLEPTSRPISSNC
jgi:hypothetical protein